MENTEVQATVEHCRPINVLNRGELVAVHENYNIQDTEEYQIVRNRPRGAFQTSVFGDFKSFVEAEQIQSANIFVDYKNIQAVAVLNFGEENAQGHCDYTATLQLEPTTAWTKLNKLKNQKLNQKDFAVFLEDWVDLLVAYDADNNVIEHKEALNAVRNMKIDSNFNTESAVENTREVRSAVSEIAAKAKQGKLPAHFIIRDSTYVELDARDIKLRLLVNANDGNPLFTIQIVREELMLNEIVLDFKEKVLNLLPENPVRIGTFQA